MTVKFTNSY